MSEPDLPAGVVRFASLDPNEPPLVYVVAEAVIAVGSAAHAGQCGAEIMLSDGARARVHGTPGEAVERIAAARRAARTQHRRPIL